MTAPTHAELVAYAHGKLTPAEIEELSVRLEQFPSALAELQTLADAPDPMLETIREAVPAARYAGEQEFRPRDESVQLDRPNIIRATDAGDELGTHCPLLAGEGMAERSSFDRSSALERHLSGRRALLAIGQQSLVECQVHGGDFGP